MPSARATVGLIVSLSEFTNKQNNSGPTRVRGQILTSNTMSSAKQLNQDLIVSRIEKVFL